MNEDLDHLKRWLPRLGDMTIIFDIGCDRLESSTPILRDAFPGATIHAFDPDPRNVRSVIDSGRDKALGVLFYAIGMADTVGHRHLWFSKHAEEGKEWTLSSSIKEPVGLFKDTHPVKFDGDGVFVFFDTVDHFCRTMDIGHIDFINLDVQSAEDLVIAGASMMLRKTHYLHMEHNTGGCYHGEVGLEGLLRLLPGWEILECFPYDVLLENKRFTRMA